MNLLPLWRHSSGTPFGAACLLVLSLPNVRAQPNYATPYYFTTHAGSGVEGSTDATGAAATFRFPNDVTVDASGNAWVADSNNGRIRKITPFGVVTTLLNSMGQPLGFGQIRGIQVDSSGNLYIGSYTSHTIQKVTLTPTTVLSVLAGQNNTSGTADGTGAAARFNLPVGVAVASNGNVFVADRGNHTIRMITPAGVVTTLAGSAGNPGSADGTGSAARFNNPWGIAIDPNGNLYVTDQSNHTIRRVTQGGAVTTFAGSPGLNGTLDATGTAARFFIPSGIAADSSGNVYVTSSAAAIRKITPAGVTTTIAGLPGSPGDADGLGSAARFQGPIGVAVDNSGVVYVADANNNKIRRSVPPPASVVIAPSGAATVNPGVTVTFTATVVRGVDDVTLQWRKDGVAISGATAGSLVIPNVQLANVGLYSVVASTLGGSITSANTALSVLVPPVITTQPANQTVAQSSSFRFSVSVSPGVGPTFVWRKNGVAIPGATGAVYEKSSAALADAGQYSVVVSHAGSSVTSNIATLTVLELPTVTAPSSQTVNAGANVQFVATITPTTATIQWRKDNVVIPGATTAVLNLTNVNATHAGIYEVSASSAGTTAFASTQLIVNVPPTIVTQPANLTVTLGQPAQFSVVVAPTTGVTYQWRKNGAAIAGATASTFSIGSVATTDAGTYSVVATRNALSVTSTNASLVVDVPVSGQPVTHTVFVGAPVHFNFTSTPTPGTTFQWRKDGVAIAGATNASFSIPSATLADAGNYNVVFVLAGVSQTSNTATLIVLPLAAPTIAVQPASQAALIGATVQFNVGATSATTPTFQWRRNGSPIAGATTEILTLSNVQPADAGLYSVVVTNAGGPTTSNNATLTVNAPVGTAPTITAQPVNQIVNAGAAVSLSVSAAGTTPLAFQWYQNGAALPGATAALFTLSSAQAANEGSYSVVVSNSAGIATSNAAVVRVNAPPVITSHPAAASVVAGANHQLTAVATGSAPLAYQWRKDGAALPGATSATLAFNPVQPGDAGVYAIVVTNAVGSTTSNPALLQVAPSGPSARLSNVSIRTVLPAGQAVIVGFAVEGGPREVLIRAIGPSLSAFGVPSTMADPRVDLFLGPTLAASNEDWPASLAAAFANAGAFALSPGTRDAALLQNVNGVYSIQVRGTGAGAVLVEAYDVGTGNSPRLVNISARNRVGTGDDILIAGFAIVGTGTKQLLIRAVGPGLAAFNVPGTLANPRLDVFNSAGTNVAQNDDWPDSLAPIFTTVGAFGLTAGSRDAVLLTSLPVGSYTVQVRGADNGTGDAIVEIYEVP